jgi:hypothetical protein
MLSNQCVVQTHLGFLYSQLLLDSEPILLFFFAASMFEFNIILILNFITNI